VSIVGNASITLDAQDPSDAEIMAVAAIVHSEATHRWDFVDCTLCPDIARAILAAAATARGAA
jgi:hypothetical protein